MLPRCHSEGDRRLTRRIAPQSRYRAPVEIKAALYARRLGATADRTEAHLLTVLERAVRRPPRNETIWRGKTSRGAQPEAYCRETPRPGRHALRVRRP